MRREWSGLKDWLFITGMSLVGIGVQSVALGIGYLGIEGFPSLPLDNMPAATLSLWVALEVLIISSAVFVGHAQVRNRSRPWRFAALTVLSIVVFGSVFLLHNTYRRTLVEYHWFEDVAPGVRAHLDGVRFSRLWIPLLVGLALIMGGYFIVMRCRQLQADRASGLGNPQGE